MEERPLQRLTNLIENSITDESKKKGILDTALSWVTGNNRKSDEDCLEEAFSTLDVFEKIVYYCWVVDWLCRKTCTNTSSFNEKMVWVGQFRSTGFLERLV